jgi:hypothetical protein
MLVAIAKPLLTAIRVVLALITSVKTRLVILVKVTASAFQAQLARRRLEFASNNKALHVQLQISVYLVYVAVVYVF